MIFQVTSYMNNGLLGPTWLQYINALILTALVYAKRRLRYKPINEALWLNVLRCCLYQTCWNWATCSSKLTHSVKQWLQTIMQSLVDDLANRVLKIKEYGQVMIKKKLYPGKQLPHFSMLLRFIVNRCTTLVMPALCCFTRRMNAWKRSMHRLDRCSRAVELGSHQLYLRMICRYLTTKILNGVLDERRLVSLVHSCEKLLFVDKGWYATSQQFEVISSSNCCFTWIINKLFSKGGILCLQDRENNKFSRWPYIYAVVPTRCSPFVERFTDQKDQKKQ